MEPDAGARQLRELLHGMEYALLTTHQADGALTSRPLQLLDVDDAGVLWFFTSLASAKADELRRDARVNLAFADPAARVFVSISGSAEVLVDPARADALWRASQKVFFPHGAQDPTLGVLKVVAHSARYWDGNESMLGLLLKYGKAVLRAESSDLGSSGELELRNGQGPTRS